MILKVKLYFYKDIIETDRSIQWSQKLRVLWDNFVGSIGQNYIHKNTYMNCLFYCVNIGTDEAKATFLTKFVLENTVIFYNNMLFVLIYNGCIVIFK